MSSENQTNEPQPKPKILCVDDESATLDSLERLLRKDFEVLRATSGEEGLDLLADHPDCSVILSDQRMPGLDGVEFLKKARNVTPDAVRAILSGQIDLSDMAEAINLNLIHRFILKPWDNEYLRVQLLEALQTHRLLTEKRQLESLSITDAVTLLTNHRYFQERLEIEVERAQRHERELSLLIIDVDHFKRFNDQYGHVEGDSILTSAARRISDQVRSIDIVSRYGGEEFTVIMPDTNMDEAFKVAERIRWAFERAPFTGPHGRPTFITLSLGVATFPHHGLNAAALISAADHALYQAKRQGRNQSIKFC